VSDFTRHTALSDALSHYVNMPQMECSSLRGKLKSVLIFSMHSQMNGAESRESGRDSVCALGRTLFNFVWTHKEVSHLSETCTVSAGGGGTERGHCDRWKHIQG